MDKILAETNDLKYVLDKLQELDNLISQATGSSEVLQIENQKEEYLLQIAKLYLKRKLDKGELTEQIIQEYAALVAKRELTKVSNLEQKKHDENQYNLFSDFVVSNKTGEKIDISSMNITEKIRAIYEHTGQVVSFRDSFFMDHRDNSYEGFVEMLSQSLSVAKIKEQLGEDWQMKIEQAFKKGYDDYIERHIESIVTTNNKSDKFEESREISVDKLNSQNQELTTKLEAANREIVMLLETNQRLEAEVAVLSREVTKLQQTIKNDLQNLRDSISGKKSLHSDGALKSVATYRDGTVKPDIPDNERGRMTTYRQSRANGEETGMQQRVNDVAHVHDRLSDEERDVQQRKYEELFGPIVEAEEEPHKRM